jgi:hypothetical protein
VHVAVVFLSLGIAGVVKIQFSVHGNSEFSATESIQAALWWKGETPVAHCQFLHSRGQEFLYIYTVIKILICLYAYGLRGCFIVTQREFILRIPPPPSMALGLQEREGQYNVQFLHSH